jgi:DNA-binding response OmpR family regulator
MQDRLTLLIIESEPTHGISTRRLLLENARHNVLTAYSAAEGLALFSLHPVDAVVVDSRLDDVRCDDIARQMKDSKPAIPIIALSAVPGTPEQICKAADHVHPAFDPAGLLRLLEHIAGEN